MNPENTQQYIPGVCNIGPKEISRRRSLGWIGLFTTIVVFVVFILLKLNPWWRLIVFLPATASASGFLQAQFHFCSGYARTGMFNFGNIGQAQHISEEEKDARAKDRKRGNQITRYAALIGAIVAIIALLV
jgi:hypothetical protein